MTVNEYRKKYPNCKYCKHSKESNKHCYAKRKFYTFNKAKRCPLYEPKCYWSDN